MPAPNSNAERPEATDQQFSVEPAHLAMLFGQRAKQLMREGRDPREAARLAGSYGQRALAAQVNVIGRGTWGN